MVTSAVAGDVVEHDGQVVLLLEDRSLVRHALSGLFSSHVAHQAGSIVPEVVWTRVASSAQATAERSLSIVDGRLWAEIPKAFYQHILRSFSRLADFISAAPWRSMIGSFFVMSTITCIPFGPEMHIFIGWDIR